MISSGKLFMIGMLLVVVACIIIATTKRVDEEQQTVGELPSVLCMAGVAAIIVAILVGASCMLGVEQPVITVESTDIPLVSVHGLQHNQWTGKEYEVAPEHLVIEDAGRRRVYLYHYEVDGNIYQGSVDINKTSIYYTDKEPRLAIATEKKQYHCCFLFVYADYKTEATSYTFYIPEGAITVLPNE